LNKIKDLLLNPVLPEALRQDIAKIYAAVLPAVNRYVLPEGEEHDSPQIKAINKFITEEFCWLKRLFRDKKYNLSFTMRNILRETWSWHYKYSKNVELRNAANLCEEAYYINENHSALDKFLNYNLLSVEALEKQYLDAYMRWIKDKPTQTILDFLQEASLYDPTCVHAYNVSFLGTQLGKELNDEKQFNELCKTLLPFSNPSYQWYFVTSLLKSYLMQIRTNNPENAVEILRQYITDVSDISVLIINYYSQPWRDVGQLVPEDLKFVVQYIQSYNDSFKKYHLLAELTFCFWTELTKLIDETWEQMSNDDKTNYCYGLINNAPYLKSIKKYNKFEWKPEYSQWLIDKLCLIENVDWLDNQRYHLDNFLPLKGCKSVSWLLEIIQKRNKQFGDSTVFSHRFYLTYFVKPDFDNDADIAALDTLIEMSTENTMVGYDLPSYLRRLDTESIKLGAIVAQKIADTKDIERILQLAEIGGAFHRNTKAWNEISAAVCAASQELPEKERISLYVALDGHRIQDCSHSIGQVPVFYCKQLSDNKEGMEKEENPIRNEYWKKEVEWAERQLLRAEEDAKEERGE